MDSTRDGPGGSISKTASCALHSPAQAVKDEEHQSIVHSGGRDRLGQQAVLSGRSEDRSEAEELTQQSGPAVSCCGLDVHQGG